ncbi:chorion peroxidase-like [Argopecten irradians]|uniref:chorion peroxidase-like n=1 Tax=Argopecten irradians TaxID=31199 RepID=UPI0037242D1E
MASGCRTSFLSVMLALCLSVYLLNLTHGRITNYAALPSLIARSVNIAVMELQQMKQLERQHHSPGGSMIGPPSRMHHTHILPSGDTAVVANMNDKSYITVRASKELARLTNTPLHLLRADPAVNLEWRRQIAPHCNLPLIRCNPTAPYRTIDGTCNNLQNPTWGASMKPQLRYLPPAYDDGRCYQTSK